VVSLSETVQSPVVHSVQKSTYFDVRTCVRELAKAGYTRPIFASHTRYHMGMHGLHEGAFHVATREYLGAQRPVFHSRRSELIGRSAEWIRESAADSIISTIAPPDDIRKGPGQIPWIGVTGVMGAGHSAAVVHDLGAITKTGLDFMTGLLQRSEYGIPEHPVVLRVCGHWQNQGLRKKSQ